MPEAVNYDYEKKVKNLPYRKFLTFFWKIFYYNPPGFTLL